MALTVGSNVYACSLEIAETLAAQAGLLLIFAPWESEMYKNARKENLHLYPQDYYAWEDKQLGGGAARITWYKGIMWVSAHSGYAMREMTDEIALVAQEDFGLVPISNEEYKVVNSNPRIYGTERIDSYYEHEGD